MKPWVRDTLRSLGRYLAIFGGGLAVFMVIAPIVGYSTYGDRAPAGWHGWFPPLEWSEFPGYLLFVTEFLGVLLLPWAAVLFLVPLATVRYLERRAASRRLTATVGGVLTGALSGYALLGAAWYVSLGLSPLIAGVVLATYVGACQLPHSQRTPRAA
ncbi:MAG TPA: hypothetical protein VK657_10330 [Terriglobales bacterium]|nr:hypothetical protein [Terriglobales bacterium]